MLVLAPILVLLLSTSSLAQSSVLDEVPAVNPHTQTGNCHFCHIASEESLKSRLTFSSTKRSMKKDLNQVCQQCHGVEFGHGIGKSPKLNRDNLPMDDKGYIACAITCHEMHVKTTDQHQSKFHLRAPSMKLCLSCHDH